MQNLRQPNKNEALSVDARQETDLRIGCAFTRFQTKFFQGKYGDLNSRLVSFGPCQTPTLGFCVKRHDRIQAFKPEPFWRISATAEASDPMVVNVTKKVKAKPRPQGLNTVELLRIASASLGIGPHSTMATAERLYTSGFINYPRTESTAYPPSLDLKALLRPHANSMGVMAVVDLRLFILYSVTSRILPTHTLTSCIFFKVNHPKWGSIVSDLLKTGYSQPRAGHNAGDHPPIAPMRLALDLSGDAARIYEYVAQHFIATLMPDCRYEVTTVLISIGDEKFTASCSRVLEPGFTKILTWQAVEDTQLPDSILRAGATLSLADKPCLLEGQTGSPGYLTEAELITAMEKHGIGTDASIPVHIENICERSYVELQPGRKLKPTPLGIVLVHGYHSIDPELVLPHMRRAVEEQLNHIATGNANFRDVLQFVLAIFSAKFRFFVEHISFMDQLFEVSFSSLADCGKPLSR
ncbi:unnamed protein product [Schistocephalus solidus]|uniref:DNA topoisomerase n=1 Tax=Schistocephalus solidus TaxID=70667 RepID=A0A183TCC5_SCHSO|nr:unnamed protein product [Schistocephalus solidus]